MTKIAVTTCYHPKLSKYLESFKRQWPSEFHLILEEVDFSVVPEHVSRETMLNQVRDYDAVFTVDADEFFLPKHIDKLVEAILNGKHDSVFCKVLDYADSEHIYAVRDHKPIILVKPRDITFYDGRCLRGFTKPLYVENFCLHHFGYTFSDEIMQWKAKNYWDKGNPDGIKEVMTSEKFYFPMPKEIREYAKAS